MAARDGLALRQRRDTRTPARARRIADRRSRRVRAGDHRRPAPYVPVAILARALGGSVDVRDVRTVAAAYHPHTEATPEADAALQRLLASLPGGQEELVAARVAVLVQACEATAGLVRGDDLPVPVTRRVDPEGNVIEVSLVGRPFGEGARRCPARRSRERWRRDELQGPAQARRPARLPTRGITLRRRRSRRPGSQRSGRRASAWRRTSG